MPKPKSPWDIAAKQPLARGCSNITPASLEPGVRFFVRMLEQLGCKTEWSCEGHPNHFYVVFYGPERVAREIMAAGVFAVNLWYHGGWQITIDAESIDGRRQKPWTDLKRRRSLRLASELWVDHFGDLGADYPESLVVEPRDRTARSLRELTIAADAFLGLDDSVDDSVELDMLLFAIEDAYAALAADPQTLTT